MFFLQVAPTWWIAGYVIFGLLVANGIRVASGFLGTPRPSCIPWLPKTYFPLHVNFRDCGDPETWGTVFWNRSTARTLVGIVVVTAIWPLRLGGSLLGWLLLGLLDGIAYCCRHGNRAVVSRFP